MPRVISDEFLFLFFEVLQRSIVTHSSINSRSKQNEILKLSRSPEVQPRCTCPGAKQASRKQKQLGQPREHPVPVSVI